MGLRGTMFAWYRQLLNTFLNWFVHAIHGQVRVQECMKPVHQAPLRSNSFSEKAQTRESLLASLRGKTIRIRDLRPLFDAWPTKVNPEVDRMRDDITNWLDKTIPAGNTLDALKRSDFGLFGGTWWPCAHFDRLRIVTYLAVWLFTWDDEIDVADGTLWNEFDTAQSYRDQTLAYIRYSLGIDEKDPYATNQIILNFEPIGAAVQECYNLEQRTMVYEEIEYFIKKSEEEQRLRLDGRIPSLEEFWEYRLGSSAVTVCLALNEFSWEDMCLPKSFYANREVKRIIRYTNTIISAVNDLLSIKKEIKRKAIDSLIPIIYFRTGSIQLAVEEVVDFIASEIENFDRAAEALCYQYRVSDEKLQCQVKDFVDGCKQYCTGNLIWSLETDRYGVDAGDGKGEIMMRL